MRLSKKYRFCFVHIPKTGGTSIARAMDNGLHDYSLVKDSQTISRPGRACRKLFGRPLYRKHEGAFDIAQKHHIADMRYFAVVRNPWDWLVSFYYFMATADVKPDTGKAFRHPLHDTVKQMSFDAFVEWVVFEHGLNQLPERKKASFADKTPVLQSDWLTSPDGELMTDKLIRFENMQSDFDEVCAFLGLPRLSLPHVNKGKRKQVSEAYGSRSYNLVGDYFEADLVQFDYV